jgi:hypothetical protein
MAMKAMLVFLSLYASWATKDEEDDSSRILTVTEDTVDAQVIPGVVLDVNNEFPSYPGEANPSARCGPCGCIDTIAQTATGLMSWTPYGKKDAVTTPLAEEEDQQCTLKAVYYVGRHCTRLPTGGGIAGLLKNAEAFWDTLKPEVQTALTNLNASVGKWADNKQKWGDLNAQEQSEALHGATDSDCTKCGMQEVLQIGKNFGDFLEAAMGDRKAKIDRSATHVSRTQATSHAFFTGLKAKVPVCPAGPTSTGPCGEYMPTTVPRCEGPPASLDEMSIEEVDELNLYLRGRAHTVCKSFQKAPSVNFPQFDEYSLEAKKKLGGMFKTEPSSSSVWKKATKLAMTMCADFAARGAPAGVDWCKFLDAGLLNELMSLKASQNAQKQGPEGPKEAWKHLALLAMDIVKFSDQAQSIYGDAGDDLPVRVIHAHAETVLPLLTFLGYVSKENTEGVNDVISKVFGEGLTDDEKLYGSGETFNNRKHVPFAANIRFEFYECGGAWHLRTILNEVETGFVTPVEDWKGDVEKHLIAAGYPKGIIASQSAKDQIEALREVCGGLQCGWGKDKAS